MNDLICQNCRRHDLLVQDVVRVAKRDVVKHSSCKYYNLKGMLRDLSQDFRIILCKDCYGTLCVEHNNPRSYWCAMLWRFLSSSLRNDQIGCGERNVMRVDLQSKWALIPSPMRKWWLPECIRYDPSLTLDEPAPKFFLVTEERNQLLNAIYDLRWTALEEQLNLHLAYTEVRCPFGDSEFLHKTNLLPLEDFLTVFDNYRMNSFSRVETVLSWVHVIMPSFPCSCFVLENPSFRCRPCLVLDNKQGLSILACRNHNTTFKQRLLYPPTSPTGCLYSRNSNQYAPVVIQSRSLRKVKLHTYSDTYQTVKLTGGYDGMDTAYLTSYGRYVPTDKLSCLRDDLSISGRDDVKSHVINLCKDPSSRGYIPSADVKAKLRRAEITFPDVEKDCRVHLESSTTIPLSTAVSLQHDVYNDSTTCFEYTNPETGELKEEAFEKPWLYRPVWVHPYDGYGQRFYRVADKFDNPYAWIVTGMIATIGNLWEETARSVVDNLSWEGWFMKVVWEQGHHRMNQQLSMALNKYFNDRKVGTTAKLQTLNCQSMKSTIESSFGNMSSRIILVDNGWKGNLEDDGRDTVVVINSSLFNDVGADDGDGDDVDEDNDTSIDGHCLWKGDSVWKCCFLGCCQYGSPKSTKKQGASKPSQKSQRATEQKKSTKRTKKKKKKKKPRKSQKKKGASHCNAAQNTLSWDGWIYARHQDAFGSLWWIQPSKKRGWLKTKKQFAYEKETSWLVAVYVRDKTLNHLEKERTWCLETLGGQTSMLCTYHNSYLVAYPRRRKGSMDVNVDSTSTTRHCCMSKSTGAEGECGQHPSWKCPLKGCRVAVCDNHFVELLSTMSTNQSECRIGLESAVFVSPNDHLSKPQQHDIEFNLNGWETNDDGDDDDDDYNDDDNSETASSDDSSLDSYDPSESEEDVGNDYKDYRIDADQIGPCDPFESCEDLYTTNFERGDMDCIPTSTASYFPSGVYEEIRTEEDDAFREGVDSVPLHCVLNHQGHLLTRKKKFQLGSRRAAFFQKIISMIRGRSIPLIYPEGCLFPDTFFYNNRDGDVLGAIPAPLLTDEGTLSMFGIATMRDHIKNRMHNPALLCSTDPRYHFFCFDELVNLGLRCSDSRVVLHRGMSDQQDQQGVAFRHRDGTEELYGDKEETYSNVYKLSFAAGEYPADTFWTQTCNATSCHGLKVQRGWTTSNLAVRELSDKYGVSDIEARDYLRDSATQSACRIWKCFNDLWTKYLLFSPEKPLGTTQWHLGRDEFQPTKGNLSHTHHMHRTIGSTVTECMERSKGCIPDLFNEPDVLHLMQIGVIRSYSHLMELMEMAEKFLPHVCSEGGRCMIPITTLDGDTEFVCKEKQVFFTSPCPTKHVLHEIPCKHNSEAVKILIDCGLATMEPIFEGCDVKLPRIIEPALRMMQHFPRCFIPPPQISPTNLNLFARYPSQSNLQFATGHSLSVYLSKYMTELDEGYGIEILPPLKSRKDFRYQAEYSHNTKINSVKQFNKRRKVMEEAGSVVMPGAVSSLSSGARSLSGKASGSDVARTNGANKESNGSNRSNESNGSHGTSNQASAASSSDRSREQQRSTSIRTGRPITHPEVITILEGENVITTNLLFIKMPTSPREYRAGFLLHNKVGQSMSSISAVDMQAIRAVTGRTIRNEKKFPNHRCFTSGQIVVIQDELLSPLSIDRTTWFSIRPPELLCIDQQKAYLKFFEAKRVVTPSDPIKQFQYLRQHLDSDIDKCAWMDGCNNKILLRRECISECLAFVRGRPFEAFHCNRSFREQLILLLMDMEQLHILYDKGCSDNLRHSTRRKNRWKRYCETFLTDKVHRNPPVVWCTPIYPTNRNRFLIHILLALGSFETEFDLMMTGNIRSAFVEAGLFDPANSVSSFNLLLRRYIMELLRFVPGSTFRFDLSLVQAKNLLDEILMGKEPVNYSLPPVLLTHMKDEADDKVVSFLDNQMERLIDTTLEEFAKRGFIDKLPSKEELIRARDIPLDRERIDTFFPPRRGLNQSEASFREQQVVLAKIREAADAYRRGEATPGIITIGGPGVGKTFLAQWGVLYCLSIGMVGITTSIMADRSKELGGTHLHQLFGMKSEGSGSMSPGRWAEITLANIFRRPELVAFIKRMGFIVVDEYELINAEFLAALDIILRYIRQTNSYMGGLLICGTGDILQIISWKGTPSMLSMRMLTDFQFFELTQSVRAANDPILQRIMQLTRNCTWTLPEETEFQELILQNCRFVPSFDDDSIPPHAVFIFARKAPCKVIEKLVQERMKQLYPNHVVSHAQDEESTSQGRWMFASKPMQNKLERKCKCPQQLLFYPQAKYQFTRNKRGCFQQGQLCLCLSVPTQEDVTSRKPVAVWAAPPGCKEYPAPELMTPTLLQQRGWYLTKVCFEEVSTHKLTKRVQGRRCQYWLRPRIAYTVHSSMGCTLSTIVTAVVPSSQDSTLKFELWQAGQVVVLLSRTGHCKDIIFVGDPRSTVRHLLQILKKRSRYVTQMRILTSRLCHNSMPTLSPGRPSQTDAITVDNPVIFRPCDAVIVNTAAVYLLISLRDTHYTYIGQTKTLRKRLKEHNQGIGSIPTSDPALRPWGLYAYIVGFHNQGERLQFEKTWQLKSRKDRTNQILLADAEDVLHLGENLIDIWRRKGRSLQMIRCGNLSSV